MCFKISNDGRGMGENEFGGPWSKDKLYRVEDYISAYLTAMSRQRWCNLVYIDAFAGSGYQKLPDSDGDTRSFLGDANAAETRSFIAGSAMRAIAASENAVAKGHRGFSRFVFIDKEQATLDTLRDHISSEYPMSLPFCSFICGDANEKVPEVVVSQNWTSSRGVAFVDPFSMSIRRSTLDALSATKSLDVWFLFPLMAVTRVMERGHEVRPSWSKKLDDMYGGHEWERAIYHEDNQLSLFGDSCMLRRGGGTDEILRYTTKWLNEIFPQVHESPYILRSATNSPLFALYAMLSSKSTTAAKLWKKLVKGVFERKTPYPVD